MNQSEKLKMFYWKTNHRVNEDGIIERQCSKCKEWKEENTDNFYLKNKKHLNQGFTPECKKCSIKRTQKNRSKIPINILKKKRKESYQKNKDIENKQSSEWKKKNRDRKREYEKEYYSKNPDKFYAYGQDRRNINHNISKKEWEACLKYFDYSCAYCNFSMEEHKIKHKQQLHKEHVIHNGENDLTNCIPACKHCNCSKWEYSLNDWYNEQNIIFKQERYNKILKWLYEDCFQYIEDKKQNKKYNKKGIRGLRSKLPVSDDYCDIKEDIKDMRLNND